MYFKLALLAAFGVALSNGVAAVLEKISADKHKKVSNIRLTLLLHLIQDWPYAIGILLDIIAWALTLIAVHTLPLFVVQPIVAFSVVVTVAVEVLLMHRNLRTKVLLAIALIVTGLALLATTAAAEKATTVSLSFKLIVLLMPIVLAIIVSALARLNSQAANISLGVLSGISFGATAITGRMLDFTHPYWHIILNPLLWALAAYGIIGLLAFTIALQRHTASIVAAASITADTLFPLLIGIFFLGDQPRQGTWLEVAIGVALTLLGAVIISLSEDGALLPNFKEADW